MYPPVQCHSKAIIIAWATRPPSQQASALMHAHPRHMIVLLWLNCTLTLLAHCAALGLVRATSHALLVQQGHMSCDEHMTCSYVSVFSLLHCKCSGAAGDSSSQLHDKWSCAASWLLQGGAWCVAFHMWYMHGVPRWYRCAAVTVHVRVYGELLCSCGSRSRELCFDCAAYHIA